MSSEKFDSPHYLFKLCNGQKWDEVREYLKQFDLSSDMKKKQICLKNGSGYTTFSLACAKRAPKDIIESMVSIAGKEIVYVATKIGSTPLHNICHPRVHVDVMKLLVKIGGKKLVLKKSWEGITALHNACGNDIIDVADIKPMVNIGRKELVLEQTYQRTITCLHNACYNKPTPDALKLLLDIGGKDLLMSRDNYDGSTPFHIALRNADNHGPQNLEVFVEAGDLKLFFATDKKGRTPLSLIKGLEFSDKYTSREWKNFFIYFDSKLSREVTKVREVAGLEEEDEKTITTLRKEILTLWSNIKKLEDKTKSDAKVIASLKTKVTKMKKRKKRDLKTIQALQSEKETITEVIRSLEAEKESHTISSSDISNTSNEVQTDEPEMIRENSVDERRYSKRLRTLNSTVPIKHEDIVDGVVKCPKCRVTIVTSNKGCNIITCRNHSPQFLYFCIHCKK